MYKILVVDDESDICDFMKTFFKERGFHVFTALNAEDAISITKEEHPDLVLLDIRMKGMDGIAALRHIKEFNKSAKIIMVTAMDDQEKMSEAYRLGAVDYITKPLALDHLEEAVGKSLKVSL
jgi:DNA-binding response OmpR family regulator